MTVASEQNRFPSFRQTWIAKIGVDLDELPDSSIPRFTKNADEGRYGYLADVYELGEQ